MWLGLRKRTYISNHKYLEKQFEIFNSIRAPCICFSTNLQLIKVIHCVFCTLDSQLNCPLSQIFLLAQPIPPGLLQGVGGWCEGLGAMKWQAKVTSSLKKPKYFHRCHFNLHMSSKAAKSITKLISQLCGDSRSAVCLRMEDELFEGYTSTHGCQTGLRKRPE